MFSLKNIMITVALVLMSLVSTAQDVEAPVNKVKTKVSVPDINMENINDIENINHICTAEYLNSFLRSEILPIVVKKYRLDPNVASSLVVDGTILEIGDFIELDGEPIGNFMAYITDEQFASAMNNFCDILVDKFNVQYKANLSGLTVYEYSEALSEEPTEEAKALRQEYQTLFDYELEAERDYSEFNDLLIKLENYTLIDGQNNEYALKSMRHMIRSVPEEMLKLSWSEELVEEYNDLMAQRDIVSELTKSKKNIYERANKKLVDFSIANKTILFKVKSNEDHVKGTGRALQQYITQAIAQIHANPDSLLEPQQILDTTLAMNAELLELVYEKVAPDDVEKIKVMVQNNRQKYLNLIKSSKMDAAAKNQQESSSATVFTD